MNGPLGKSLSEHELMFIFAKRIVDKPSPATFAAACLTYSLTTLIFHEQHKDDRYQNMILLVATILGVLWTIVSSASGDGNTLGLMAFCIWVSLSFSAIVHRLARSVDERRKRHKDKDENRKKMEGIAELRR